MTQEELQEGISNVVGNPYLNGNTKVTKVISFINQHVKEVIGEDLEATNYMYFYKDKYKNLPEDFKETIIKACIQYDNDLKEEQRERAGL